MAKNLDVAVLLDFYGNMLTEKQRDALDLYYNQDLSLGEIAEQEQITRQGVRDSIKRGEVLLYDMEDKLKIFETYIENVKLIQNIQTAVKEIERENENGRLSPSIQDSTGRICGMIETYLEKNT